MTNKKLLAMTAAFSAALLAQHPISQLEGCPDPHRLAAALSALQRHRWKNIAIGTVQDLWPSQVRQERCGPNCFRLSSEDRIIRGQLECGCSLRFDVDEDAGNVSRGRFESIVVKHNFPTRELREAGKQTLARAIRIGKDVTEGTGVETHGGFFLEKTWTEDKPEHRKCSLSFREADWDRGWELILDFSCFSGP